MDLNTAWFLVIAFFFTGYFVLEGFDFGVGMLLPFVGGATPEGNDRRRTAQVATIGPVWDGNEVWLITAGASLFAAFPEWYATLFSWLYLPLLFILVALIVRGVALEWRGKVDTPRWRARCDAGIAFGSYVPAVLWGIAFTNLVTGAPLDAAGRVTSFSEGFLGLFSPLGLLGGVAFALLFALHGAFFVGFKAEEPLRGRAHALATRWIAAPAVLATAAYLLWLQNDAGARWTWAALAVGLVALVSSVLAALRGRDGLAFGLTALTVTAAVVLIFGSIFPEVLPSIGAHPGWDIYSASSSPYTLKVMSWAALVMVPLVVVAQGWSYWAFRKRVTV